MRLNYGIARLGEKRAKPPSAPVTALPSTISTAVKAVEVVQTVLANAAAPAVTSVIPAPALLPVVQPREWELVKSSFIKSQVQQVMIGLVINQAQNVSLLLLSKAFHYFRRRDSGETKTLAAVASDFEVVQDRYKEVVKRLAPLVKHFHDAMRGRADSLEQADKSMALELQEALRLQLILDSLTEDDLNAAVRNLAERLAVVVAKHQENVPILVAVMDDLQTAEKDLAEAVAELEKTKREFAALVEELSGLKFLIESAGLEQDQELKALIRKLDGVLNGY